MTWATVQRWVDVQAHLKVNISINRVFFCLEDFDDLGGVPRTLVGGLARVSRLRVRSRPMPSLRCDLDGEALRMRSGLVAALGETLVRSGP